MPLLPIGIKSYPSSASFPSEAFPTPWFLPCSFPAPSPKKLLTSHYAGAIANHTIKKNVTGTTMDRLRREDYSTVHHTTVMNVRGGRKARRLLSLSHLHHHQSRCRHEYLCTPYNRSALGHLGTEVSHDDFLDTHREPPAVDETPASAGKALFGLLYRAYRRPNRRPVRRCSRGKTGTLSNVK